MMLRHLRSLQPTATRVTTRALSTAASKPLSVLVIDGYSPEGRADLEAGGASTAGKLYEQLMTKCTPGGNTVCDIVYPADADFKTPDLSKVRRTTFCWSVEWHEAHCCSCDHISTTLWPGRAARSRSTRRRSA